MIKHICGSDIIKSKQVQNNNEKFMVYKYNNEHLEFHYSLASYYSTKNITLDPFDDNIQNKNTDNKVIKTKITLKKLNFDLDGLLFYIKDGKLFLNSYFIDKNINLDDK
jgi:hypothetical protein